MDLNVNEDTMFRIAKAFHPVYVESPSLRGQANLRSEWSNPGRAATHIRLAGAEI